MAIQEAKKMCLRTSGRTLSGYALTREGPLISFFRQQNSAAAIDGITVDEGSRTGVKGGVCAAVLVEVEDVVRE
jgi:hypothetical protein